MQLQIFVSVQMYNLYKYKYVVIFINEQYNISYIKYTEQYK